jgi:hypothetical protein
MREDGRREHLFAPLAQACRRRVLCGALDGVVEAFVFARAMSVMP